MGKLKNYKGTITLAAGLSQANNQNYPLMDANAVQTKEDGTRLDKTITDLEESIKDIEEKFGAKEDVIVFNAGTSTTVM